MVILSGVGCCSAAAATMVSRAGLEFRIICTGGSHFERWLSTMILACATLFQDWEAET